MYVHTYYYCQQNLIKTVLGFQVIFLIFYNINIFAKPSLATLGKDVMYVQE